MQKILFPLMIGFLVIFVIGLVIFFKKLKKKKFDKAF